MGQHGTVKSIGVGRCQCLYVANGPERRIGERCPRGARYTVRSGRLTVDCCVYHRDRVIQEFRAHGETLISVAPFVKV
jgi:hypothetical protein